jgi:hypothetical protein
MVSIFWNYFKRSFYFNSVAILDDLPAKVPQNDIFKHRLQTLCRRLRKTDCNRSKMIKHETIALQSIQAVIRADWRSSVADFCIIDLSVIHYTHILSSRHSGKGRNPVI